MKVRIRLFALAKDLWGCESAEIVLPAGARIADLRHALAADCPAMSTLMGSSIFAVDAEYVSDEFPLAEGAEVACIPPVSGG